jgi:hypothetical protein
MATSSCVAEEIKVCFKFADMATSSCVALPNGLFAVVQGKDETGKAIQDYWKPSLTLLADKDLIARLKSYDKDNIPPK